MYLKFNHLAQWGSAIFESNEVKRINNLMLLEKLARRMKMSESDILKNYTNWIKVDIKELVEECGDIWHE